MSYLPCAKSGQASQPLTVSSSRHDMLRAVSLLQTGILRKLTKWSAASHKNFQEGEWDKEPIWTSGGEASSADAADARMAQAFADQVAAAEGRGVKRSAA